MTAGSGDGVRTDFPRRAAANRSSCPRTRSHRSRHALPDDPTSCRAYTTKADLSFTGAGIGSWACIAADLRSRCDSVLPSWESPPALSSPDAMAWLWVLLPSPQPTPRPWEPAPPRYVECWLAGALSALKLGWLWVYWVLLRRRR